MAITLGPAKPRAHTYIKMLKGKILHLTVFMITHGTSIDIN